MESNNHTPKLKTQLVRKTLKDPKEFNRILMQYGGVFKYNIKEYADKIIVKYKKQTNHSR